MVVSVTQSPMRAFSLVREYSRSQSSLEHVFSVVFMVVFMVRSSVGFCQDARNLIGRHLQNAEASPFGCRVVMNPLDHQDAPRAFHATP